jgi:hypothetical protein
MFSTLFSWSSWKQWNHLERSQYLAQLATVLTLLLTTVFSFFALREARQTRLDQAAYFLAEKAPDVRLVSLTQVAGNIVFELKNEGESIAKDITFEIRVLGVKSIGDAFKYPQLRGGDWDEIVSDINKGKMTVFRTNAKSLTDAIGFEPKGFRLAGDNESVDANREHPVIWVVARFNDLASNHYSTSAMFLAAR